jgi:hypothetical protein
MARWKHITDPNGEQVPMIIPHSGTAAYNAYAAGQYTAVADKRRADALLAEERDRRSIRPLAPDAMERIRRAIEEQED